MGGGRGSGTGKSDVGVLDDCDYFRVVGGPGGEYDDEAQKEGGAKKLKAIANSAWFRFLDARCADSAGCVKGLSG